ncbi:D-3-phosphoglycerate dehydrogenase, chloroplastic [Hordeum vulgare]|nr:D-3-phosphoglycerate dehydrogenase, chloroplastic [Hordeum vulgare]
MLHQSWVLHVRLVMEKLPMQLWTLEGAKDTLGDKVIIDRLDIRTFEHVDMKTFAVWVWVWELAHIPTCRTPWKHDRGQAA